MKKKLLVGIIISLFTLSFSFAMYKAGNRYNKERYKYFTIHPKNLYLNTEKINVIDWPEEFDPIMQETGEINSYMTFRKSKDTLKVEFNPYP